MAQNLTGGSLPVRILLVDDDPEVLMMTRKALERAGYEVHTALSGEAALASIQQRGLPHLAIIDIVMPGMGGLELGRRLHEFSDLPVFMLSAVVEESTIVQAIDEIAEDYVTKPFSPSELVARIGRILRRIGDFSYAQGPLVEVNENLKIDFAAQRAYVDDQAITLTPTEAKLLYILCRNAGRPVPASYLIQRLWPRAEVFDDTLRSHIYRLRKKIEVSPRKPRHLVTDKGKGYRLASQG